MKLLDQNTKLDAETYSWTEKIQQRGTGSNKVIYVSGIDSLIEDEKTIFFNMEIFPTGLLLYFHLLNKRVFIDKVDIDRIEIIQRRIEIKSSIIKLCNDSSITFYADFSFNKITKQFFKKQWFVEMVEFKRDDEFVEAILLKK